MRKIFKLFGVVFLLSIIVLSKNVLALSGINDNNGKITISNPIPNQSYKIYQIFQLESFDTEKGAYTYKIKSDSSWLEFFKQENPGSKYINLDKDTLIVTWKDNMDIVDFTKEALKYAKDNNIVPDKSLVSKEESLVFSNLNLGYYLVDSAIGSLCSITTTNKEVIINEKNDIPTIDKQVLENSTGEYGDSNTDEIGKEIFFKTIINAKNGAENYILYDKMDKGLTFRNNIKIENKSSNKVLEENKDYKIILDNQEYTFIIEFLNEEELSSKDKLEVTYSAYINEFAIINDIGNKNETFLKYGDNLETNHDITITKTYELLIHKKNIDNQILTDAHFILYDAKNNGNIIPLIRINDNLYRVASNNERNSDNFISTDIILGSAKIIGLDLNKDYYLEEVKAPDGYNKINNRIKLTLSIKDNNLILEGENSKLIKYYNNEVDIINITGSLLPQTGGIGTTIFITLGLIIMIVSGLFLVTKLKISKLNI